MKKNKKALLCLSLLCLTAQGQETDNLVPGQKNFGTYCAACHGAEGQGGAGGSAPPLAKSAWLAGDPARAIKIVLNGLQGELEVNGTHYNLVMPPQGAVLNDVQIASILTYTRSAWGNKESAVTAQTVAEVRKATADKVMFWQTEELLKAHPLPRAKAAKPLTPGPLKDLIMTNYRGKWKELPDFKKLKPVATEEEHGGYITLERIRDRKNYGVVWEGNLTAPENGDYTFSVRSDDGSALYLDGQRIMSHLTAKSMKDLDQKTVTLNKGVHELRFEYHQIAKDEGIFLQWTGPGIAKKDRMLSKAPSKRRAGTKKSYPLIDLTPQGSEAVMYRNFVQNTSPSNIAVGYPGGINLAFSQDHCQLELLWKGSFVSGGRHWTARGQGAVAPLGKNVISLIKTQSKTTGQERYQFQKIDLDAKRYPTFTYKNSGLVIQDRPNPMPNGLERTFTITASEAQPDFALRLLQAKRPKLDLTSEQAQTSDGLTFKMPLKAGANTYTFQYRFK